MSDLAPQNANNVPEKQVVKRPDGGYDEIGPDGVVGLRWSSDVTQAGEAIPAVSNLSVEAESIGEVALKTVTTTPSEVTQPLTSSSTIPKETPTTTVPPSPLQTF